ncbi:MAG: hypothetical protein WEB58_05080 [Planctomycetaceae bacterium]
MPIKFPEGIKSSQLGESGPMWELEYQAEFERKVKKYAKKHRQETMNAAANLQAVLEGLNAGLKMRQIVRGFIHDEGEGALAVDESGRGKHLLGTRLYFYPDEPTETVYVVTIGDKDSQKRDVKTTQDFVSRLRKNRQPEG